MSTDNSALRALMIKHGGNLAAMARTLKISRQAASQRLNALGLADEASRLRALHGISGTRDQAGGDEAEKALITEALQKHGGQRAAARALGMNRRRIQRAIERHGIVFTRRRAQS